jgi:hypothetical protein
VIDSRCGRVLDGPRREMVDDDEWAWIEEQATGDFDHLLLATSLPFALAPATHDLEAWNEAVTAGAWGRPMAWVGEKLRQGIDLEHWAAFNDSFDRLAALIESVAGGRATSTTPTWPSSPSGASTPATATARPGRRSARPCATRCRATSGPPTPGPSGARSVP